MKLCKTSLNCFRQISAKCLDHGDQRARGDLMVAMAQLDYLGHKVQEGHQALWDHPVTMAPEGLKALLDTKVHRGHEVLEISALVVTTTKQMKQPQDHLLALMFLSLKQR